MTEVSEHPNKPYEQRVTTTEAERIAVAAAKLAANDALNEMWAAFGVNRANVESMEAFKRDLMFVRDLRSASDKAKSRLWLTIWTMIVAAAGAGIWSWFKAAVTIK